MEGSASNNNNNSNNRTICNASAPFISSGDESSFIAFPCMALSSSHRFYPGGKDIREAVDVLIILILLLLAGHVWLKAGGGEWGALCGSNTSGFFVFLFPLIPRNG